MADETPTPSAPSARPAPLVIRSWPKVVMLVPSLIVALVCGILISFAGDFDAELATTGWRYVGLIFLVVLGINLTILLYDLNLRGFIIVSLLIVVLLLGLSLLNGYVSSENSLWATLSRIVSLPVLANAAFYFVFAFVLLFNLLIAWVITRFNYWKVEHNEIIIHKGFMQEQERHPTAQARFKLQIDDIVEYGIFGAGTLVFIFGEDETEHRLPNVLFARKKAKQLDELLGRVEVVTHR